MRLILLLISGPFPLRLFRLDEAKIAARWKGWAEAVNSDGEIPEKKDRNYEGTRAGTTKTAEFCPMKMWINKPIHKKRFAMTFYPYIWRK